MEIQHTKTCKKCSEAKPVADFYRDKRAPDGLRYDCKACGNAAAVAWGQANKAARLAATLRYQGKLPPERKRAVQRHRIESGLQAKHRRAYYLRHREEIIREKSAFAKRNADKIQARRRKRYAEDAAYRFRVVLYNQQRQRFCRAGSLTAGELLEIWAHYDGRCAYCFDLADTVDHVTPRARGGKHEVGNVVPACRSCNSTKKDRTPLEWLGPVPGFRTFIGETVTIPVQQAA